MADSLQQKEVLLCGGRMLLVQRRDLEWKVGGRRSHGEVITGLEFIL